MHRMSASANLTNNDEQWMEKIEELIEAFVEGMDDDFNTADGISVLFELSKQANYYLMEKNTSVQVIKTL